MPSDHPGSHLVRARAVARLLDSAVGIPGTRFRFGLDPLIGLVPGLGDLAGAALSGYIVLAGIRAGAPKPVVMRMLGNIALDSLLGAVPLLGDLFDASWKSNNRNVALIERHLEAPAEAARSSGLLLAGAALALLLIVFGGIALTVWVLKAIF